MPTLPSFLTTIFGLLFESATTNPYVAEVAPAPVMLSLPHGVVVPMPTLPSIINPPVGAAVVSYPLPKLPPPLTDNFGPGAVSPMPTLPSLLIVIALVRLLKDVALVPEVVFT